MGTRVVRKRHGLTILNEAGETSFDRKPAQEKPWTEKVWIYDLGTNMHFTLKENALKRTEDLKK